MLYPPLPPLSPAPKNRLPELLRAYYAYIRMLYTLLPSEEPTPKTPACILGHTYAVHHTTTPFTCT